MENNLEKKEEHHSKKDKESKMVSEDKNKETKNKEVSSNI